MKYQNLVRLSIDQTKVKFLKRVRKKMDETFSEQITEFKVTDSL